MGDDDLDLGDAGLSELDPEERASLTDEQVAAVQRPPALVGWFRLHRLPRDVMPFWCGALLVPIVAGLGAPLAAAALAAAVIGLFVWRQRRVVRVFEIDETGAVHLGRHGPIDWGDVDDVVVRPTPPRFVPAAQRGYHVWVLKARFRLRDGRTIRLAPGQLFQTRPQRQPIGIDQLARHLRRLARDAGLTVTTTDKDRGAWRAARPDGLH
jgi:hypothetical protein